VLKGRWRNEGERERERESWRSIKKLKEKN
jgi:hypothetical protein